MCRPSGNGFSALLEVLLAASWRSRRRREWLELLPGAVGRSLMVPGVGVTAWNGSGSRSCNDGNISCTW